MMSASRQLTSYARGRWRLKQGLSGLLEKTDRAGGRAAVCGAVPCRWLAQDQGGVNLPSEARVVICGSGVVGSSVAYHLAERGWTDVVVLEQGSATCGTTWHSAGLIGQLRGTSSEMAISTYSRSLYKRFEMEGNSVGWRECGSLLLAQTHERMLDFKRKQALAKVMDVECHLVTPSEAKQLSPLISTSNLQGGLWLPGDGLLSPTDLTMHYIRVAKERGVKFYEGVQVSKVQTERDRVKGVETSSGNIKCEFFVNCGGMWARQVGKKSLPKVAVPLHPCEHFYLFTQKVEGVDHKMPVIRDYDGGVYFREWNGGLCAGGFEPEAKPVFHTGIPDRFEYQLLPEDWDHFQVMLDAMIVRVPVLGSAEIRQLLNGPESFTPDGHWLLGEAAEIDNYFIAAGMNSKGIMGSGGVGKYLTEWIIDGDPSIDLWHMDIMRFVGLHNNKKFLKDRVKEAVGHHFMLRYPRQEYTTGRKLRTSPLHTRMEQQGATFAETVAYERPVFFNKDPEDTRSYSQWKYTFYKPDWFEAVEEEYWACKERVALVDMSSFAKFEIKSSRDQATKYLQYLSSNDIDAEIGTITHTGMQNEHGGFENDCSLVKMADNYYFMICPATQQTRANTWLRKHLPQDGSVQIRDVTSMYSGLNLVGPHAQHLLADLTDISTNKNDFKAMTCKVIDVGYASGIRAMRLTHCGEDGFILYIPSEYALHVYDQLQQAGKQYGVRNAGYYAIRHLRLEKFFAYWGLDLNARITPLECGREFRVKFDKDFIGRDALLRQREQGIGKKLVQFQLEDYNIDSEPWPHGSEPIFRNGQFCGMTTTCGYGFMLEKMICLGFVSDISSEGHELLKSTNAMNEFILDRNANYEIEIAGIRYPAKAGIFTPKKAISVSDPVLIPVPSRPAAK